MTEEYYYGIEVDGDEDSHLEEIASFYIKSKGKIDKGVYLINTHGCFQKTKGKGPLNLVEITKEEFEKVAKYALGE